MAVEARLMNTFRFLSRRLRFPSGALLLAATAATLPAFAQTARPRTARSETIAAPATRTLRGEAFFLERIALLPGARLHVALVGRVAGAEYLPLATTVVAARSGSTPFALRVPVPTVPGPYRLQAWIVGDNRALFIGYQPQTTVHSLHEIAHIRLRIVPAPQNIDGIGDGRPLAPLQDAPSQDAPNVVLSGEVLKLDRRALLPNAVVTIQIAAAPPDDAPSVPLAQSRSELRGAQLPSAFRLAFPASQLRPDARYTLTAQVFEGAKVAYSGVLALDAAALRAGSPLTVRVTRVLSPR